MQSRTRAWRKKNLAWEGGVRGATAAAAAAPLRAYSTTLTVIVVQKPANFVDNRPVFDGIDHYTRRGDFQVKDSQARASQANLDRLGAQKKFSVIVAPFDGVITARNTDVAAQLVVDGLPAAQEVVVDPEVGLHFRPHR